MEEEELIIPNNPVELNEYILELQSKIFKARLNSKEYKQLYAEIVKNFKFYNKLVNRSAFCAAYFDEDLKNERK